MTAPRKQRAAPGRAAGVAVGTETRDRESEGPLCTCCDPRNPLVLRPDLGTLEDGSAEFALCVLHEPEPVVYRSQGDGQYVQVPGFSLSPAGEIVDQHGGIVARVAGDGFQRLTTIDDDDEDRPSPDGGGRDPGPAGDRASRPRTVHVDLSQDDFYTP